MTTTTTDRINAYNAQVEADSVRYRLMVSLDVANYTNDTKEIARLTALLGW